MITFILLAPRTVSDTQWTLNKYLLNEWFSKKLEVDLESKSKLLQLLAKQ